MIFFRFAAMAIFGFSSAASVLAQNRESTLAALTKLVPAERQARIVEGAKKENGLVWYSSTTAEDGLALTKKFSRALSQHSNQSLSIFEREAARKDSRRNASQCLQGRYRQPAGARTLDHDQTETFGPVRAAGKFNLSAREQRSARPLDRTLYLGLGARA